MKKYFKKPLVLFLSLLMIVSMMPAYSLTAFAEDEVTGEASADALKTSAFSGKQSGGRHARRFTFQLREYIIN